jgi:hypothetical protein
LLTKLLLDEITLLVWHRALSGKKKKKEKEKKKKKKKDV